MAKKGPDTFAQKVKEKIVFPKPGEILRMGRVWLGVAGLIFCFIIFHTSDLANIGMPQQFYIERAKVLSVTDTNLWPDHYIPNVYVGTQRVEIEILSGEFKGQQLEIINSLTRFANLYMTEGMEILVSMMPDIEYLAVYNMGVYGPSRGPALLGAVGVLLISMLIMGRKKGFYAIITLAFTIFTVIFFMVSFIVRGYSPVAFSLITVVITTAFTLFMVSGFGRQSIAAVAGSWTGLVFAGVFSAVVGRLGNVSGLNLEEARQILYNSPPDSILRISDLLFAGILIVASGVIVDAAMSISSAVFEIKEQSPGITAKRLYRSGMNIGGDILGANSDTLILAFTGASLQTLIVITLFGFPPMRIINMDFVAIEIIQAVSATMGMIFAIPATALYSALLATRYDKSAKE